MPKLGKAQRISIGSPNLPRKQVIRLPWQPEDKIRASLRALSAAIKWIRKRKSTHLLRLIFRIQRTKPTTESIFKSTMVSKRPQAASSLKDLPLETNLLSVSPSPRPSHSLKSQSLSLLRSRSRVSTTSHLDKHPRSPRNQSPKRSRALLVSLSDKLSNSLSSSSSQCSTMVALAQTRSEQLRCPLTTSTKPTRSHQRCPMKPLNLLSSSDSRSPRSEKVN